MKTVSVLLVFFLVIAVFTRSYNKWTRLLLSTGIIVMLIYLYVA